MMMADGEKPAAAAPIPSCFTADNALGSTTLDGASAFGHVRAFLASLCHGITVEDWDMVCLSPLQRALLAQLCVSRIYRSVSFNPWQHTVNHILSRVAEEDTEEARVARTTFLSAVEELQLTWEASLGAACYSWIPLSTTDAAGQSFVEHVVENTADRTALQALVQRVHEGKEAVSVRRVVMQAAAQYPQEYDEMLCFMVRSWTAEECGSDTIVPSSWTGIMGRALAAHLALHGTNAVLAAMVRHWTMAQCGGAHGTDSNGLNVLEAVVWNPRAGLATVVTWVRAWYAAGLTVSSVTVWLLVRDYAHLHTVPFLVDVVLDHPGPAASPWLGATIASHQDSTMMTAMVQRWTYAQCHGLGSSETVPTIARSLLMGGRHMLQDGALLRAIVMRWGEEPRPGVFTAMLGRQQHYTSVLPTLGADAVHALQPLVEGWTAEQCGATLNMVNSDGQPCWTSLHEMLRRMERWTLQDTVVCGVWLAILQYWGVEVCLQHPKGADAAGPKELLRSLLPLEVTPATPARLRAWALVLAGGTVSEEAQVRLDAVCGVLEELQELQELEEGACAWYTVALLWAWRENDASVTPAVPLQLLAKAGHVVATVVVMCLWPTSTLFANNRARIMFLRAVNNLSNAPRRWMLNTIAAEILTAIPHTPAQRRLLVAMSWGALEHRCVSLWTCRELACSVAEQLQVVDHVLPRANKSGAPAPVIHTMLTQWPLKRLQPARILAAIRVDGLLLPTFEVWLQRHPWTASNFKAAEWLSLLTCCVEPQNSLWALAVLRLVPTHVWAAVWPCAASVLADTANGAVTAMVRQKWPLQEGAQGRSGPSPTKRRRRV